MRYTSQHCCDKTMDVEMALHRECFFPNCTKLWWKVTFVVFWGAIAPPWIRPCTASIQNWQTSIASASTASLVKQTRGFSPSGTEATAAVGLCSVTATWPAAHVTQAMFAGMTTRSWCMPGALSFPGLHRTRVAASLDFKPSRLVWRAWALWRQCNETVRRKEMRYRGIAASAETIDSAHASQAILWTLGLRYCLRGYRRWQLRRNACSALRERCRMRRQGARTSPSHFSCEARWAILDSWTIRTNTWCASLRIRLTSATRRMRRHPGPRALRWRS